MTTDFLKDFSEKTKEGFAPFIELNKLMGQSVQDMLKAQMAATQRYSEMTMEQVKSASKIRDVESLQGFFQQQLGTFESLNEQIMKDVQAVSDAGNQFRCDVEAIFNPSEAEDEAPEAKKPTAKSTKS